MMLTVLCLISLSAAENEEDDDPISELAKLVAEECMRESACKAKYAISGTKNLHDSHPLVRDIRAILASHGLTAGTCRALSHSGAELEQHRRILFGLAMDLTVACADPRDVADSKSSAYTIGAALAMLVISIASFIALFILSAAARTSFARVR